MVEEKKTKLTYEGRDRRFQIIATQRILKLSKGDIVEVNAKELVEIKKQPRLVTAFKELKPKDKSTKPGGGDNAI